MMAPAQPKDFDIRIWFVVVSLVAIVTINFLLAFALNRYIADRIVNREGEVAQEFLNSIVNAEASSDRLFLGSQPSAELISFSNHVKSLSDMIRANIYSPDGFIRYSSEPNLIGLRFNNNEELTESLGGKLIAELTRASDDDKPEHLALNRFNATEVMESYIPIRNSAGGVAAVVEFYKKPFIVKEIIGQITRIIWISAVLSGFVLFLALYSAIARGARIIEDQKREIGGMATLVALGQMASAVTHSLRNPLANIRSTAELLQHQHPKIAGNAARDINGEVDRMSRHLQALLEYSRADKVPMQRVALHDTLRNSFNEMSEVFERQNVKLNLKLDGAVEHLVEIDVMMFGQAISSIVTNAVEAMPDGGTIEVSVREEAGGKGLAIDISDTGMGIPKDLLNRLPQPFVTSKARGLGLGLSLARGILERFGGSLSLHSREGYGTTVTMELPKAHS